ncbi:hypothetical protein CU097_007071 [Rhizopus azygosporus]|uniref:Pseudouridine synthase RsuA/RluA-like domain-containing protein n=1 Tax=Rhizopus azygosporus TaxID=86630 RepID=A0A367JJK9_RHIAZ|nr:hypothetical protein CU097_007071 [Rhizopus azygosporus]
MLKVIHKDNNWLIVNKPYDMRIQSYNSTDPSVESILQEKYPNTPKFRNVHQLDYATSGVYVLALTKSAAALAAKQFQQRLVKKTYLALVNGHMLDDVYMVDQPIEDDPDHDFRMRISPTGRPAETHIHVLQRGYYNYNEDKTGMEKRIPVTKVRLHPISGRRHQLRLHLKYLGHPIIGDYNYETEYTDTFRMMLHAHSIRFNTGDQISEFIAEDPFESLIDS